LNDCHGVAFARAATNAKRSAPANHVTGAEQRGSPRVSNDNVSADNAVIARLSGARALVTGGAGFIGTRLCDLLREAGWTVWSASRRAQGPALAHRHVQVNLADAEATRVLVQAARPDYVFHLAGQLGATTEFDLVMPTFHSNLHATVNLLHALVGANCRRIVIAGSQIEPVERGGEAVPGIPYALSKWASSEYLRMFQTLYQLPGVIGRLFMVYGPGQDVSKLVPYVIGSVLRGERPRLTTGRRAFDWIYVDDVAHGLARMAVAPIASGSTVDLGTGTPVRTAALVRKIYELLKCDEPPPFGTLPDRAIEPVRVARIEETRRQLDWAPRVPLEEGLTRTIEWFRQYEYGGSAASQRRSRRSWQ
jgi:UDP-glucose 4-epimerase